jgi:N utilization substance protein B
VLQVLYGWDLVGDEEELRPFARRVLTHRRVSDRYRPYIERLLDVLQEHVGEVDEVLRETIPNWRLERLAVVDRNVLRIGAAELLFVDDVPGKVAIHEAIQLAEKYGSEESPRFVNGVLDGLYQSGRIPAGG